MSGQGWGQGISSCHLRRQALFPWHQDFLHRGNVVRRDPVALGPECRTEAAGALGQQSQEHWQGAPCKDPYGDWQRLAHLQAMHTCTAVCLCACSTAPCILTQAWHLCVYTGAHGRPFHVSPHFLKNQGAKEVLFPFLKDDKCTDINIYLVPMATIFNRGMELVFLLPVWFYLSWTFQTSLCLGSGGSCLKHPRALRYPPDDPPRALPRVHCSPVLPLCWTAPRFCSSLRLCLPHPLLAIPRFPGEPACTVCWWSQADDRGQPGGWGVCDGESATCSAMASTGRAGEPPFSWVSQKS